MCPCIFKTTEFISIYPSEPIATDDPPRPTFDSVLSRDMAGYMPARADFMEVKRMDLFHSFFMSVFKNNSVEPSLEVSI